MKTVEEPSRPGTLKMGSSVLDLISHAECNGLMMNLPNERKVHAPFTAKSSDFPRELYDQALALQPLFSRLVAEMVKERSFLSSLAQA